MREKNWLLKVMQEASERVDAWPDWKKSKDLKESEKNGKDESENDDGAPREYRCA